MSGALSALNVLLLFASPICAGLRPAPESLDEIQPVQVDESVMASRLVKQIQPVYPPLARSAGYQGSVVLSVHIGKDGSVLDTKVVGGPPLLANAAVVAVRQWRYRPLLVKGEAVEVITTVTVPFKLPDAAPSNIDQLREAAKLHPDDVAAHDQLAHALLANGQTEEAIRELEQVVRLAPESGRFHGQLAQALENKGNVDAALAEYRKASELDPKEHQWQRGISQILLKKGQREEALDEYRSLLRQNPNEFDYGEFASILYFTGPLAEATKQLAAVVDGRPDAAELHRTIGGDLKESVFLAAGIIQTQEALRMNPNDAEAKAQLKVFLSYRQREHESMSKLREEIRKDPTHGSYLLLAWDAYLTDGDTDAVRSILQEGLRMQPQNDQLRSALEKFAQCQCPLPPDAAK